MPRDERTFLGTAGLITSVGGTKAEESAGAPRAGADLRAARLRLDWPLSDVASSLRIRISHLEALEDGRLDLLPGNAFALGYLRTYANALGLDGDEMVRRFKAEAEEVTQRTELVFPAPVPERGLPAGAFALLGLLLVGAAYAGWFRLSGEGKLPAETVAPVPARLAALADQALPGPDGRVEIPAPPREEIVPPAPPAAAQGNDTFEPRMAAPENQPPRPEPVRVVTEAPQTQSGPSTAIAAPVFQPMRPDAPTAGVPSGTSNNVRILLRFTGDTWLQIKERGGASLINRVMKEGETFAVPDRPNLTLNTGNAGGLQILVDGVMAPSMGTTGVVRKDVPLDPDQLKNGLATPVAASR